MKKQLALALALTGLLAANTASALVIDNFDTGAGYNSTSPQTGNSAGTSSAGYARSVTSTGTGGTTNVQINNGTNTGVYAHIQSSATTIGTSLISYDLGTGVNLTQPVGGFTANAFEIDLTKALNVPTASPAGGRVFIIAYNGATFVKKNLEINPIVALAGGTPAYAQFLFSDFTGINFTNVTKIELGFNSNVAAAMEVSVSSLETVCTTGTTGGSGSSPGAHACTIPAPGALWLVGLGLGLVGGVTRRRRARV